MHCLCCDTILPPMPTPKWYLPFRFPDKNSAHVVEPGYNDIGLCIVSSIASDILWYHLIPHC